MQVKKSIQALIDSAKASGSMVEETQVTVMVSRVGASSWAESERLMIFADGTATAIAPDNITRRQVRTIKGMKQIIGVA
jgi:hypothetical protein